MCCWSSRAKFGHNSLQLSFAIVLEPFLQFWQFAVVALPTWVHCPPFWCILAAATSCFHCYWSRRPVEVKPSMLVQQSGHLIIYITFRSLSGASYIVCNYSALAGVQSIVVNPSVCASLCLSVCEHISGTALPIVTKFCLQMWPWLSPLAALRYVMYFQFYGWCHIWL